MVKRIFASIGRYIRQTDILLFLLCLLASSLGILMLFGIVNAELMKISRLYVQIAATVLGIIAAIIMSKIDYHFMAKLWKLHVPCAILLVLLTFVWGQQRGEADDKAWIFFNLSSSFQISIQPSEILKISFVLSFALHLEAVRENINKLKNVIFLCISRHKLEIYFPCNRCNGRSNTNPLEYHSQCRSKKPYFGYLGL